MADQKEIIVEVRNAEKKFSTVKAVDDLSFEIREGEIFALLGPNGAGKTTMVRMLLNIIKPDRGKIRYLQSNNSQLPPSDIGYLPEERGLYQDIPVLKSLRYFGIIRGMERTSAEDKAVYWLERFDLKERMYEKVQSLSKGNQQKVQFIASILHSPAFAVLDEPFSGLDPINQELFSQIIKELCTSGTTILLSAHQMQLVERIADRILLINKGKEVMSGTLDQIRRKSDAGNKIVVQFENEIDLALLDDHPSVQSIESINTSKFVIFIKPEAKLSDLIQMLGTHYEVQSVHSEHMSLHDIYVKAIGTQL